MAIEASQSTFAILATNVAPHAGLVTAVQRAVFDRSGVEIRLGPGAHEARGIVHDAEQSFGESVTSVAVDDLLAERGWIDRELIIKLDVEGAERQALVGMEQALRRDALIIYEDHGSDMEHSVTRHVRHDRELEAHLLLDHGSLPIRHASDLDRRKRDRTKGYNLIAYRAGGRWQSIFSS